MLALTLATLTACGDDKASGGDGGRTDAKAGGMDAGMMDMLVAGDSGGPAETAGGGDRGPDMAGGGQDGSVSAETSPPVDGGGASDTSGGSDGPAGIDGPAGGDSGGSSATYAAELVAGGLNRLVITKFDPDRRLCFRLQLAEPLTPSLLPIEVPQRWGVERAGVTANTDTCPIGLPLPSPASAATGASGHVRWMGFMPCTIDLDVELVFAPPAPGGVIRERLSRSGLKTRNC
jgi:hypothetical protein